jgi:arylsulfatase A-like enzyme
MDVHDWYVIGDPEQSRQHFSHYGDGVADFDIALGVFLDELDHRGWLDDAVVVLVADHGEALGEEHPLTALATHFGNPSYETVLRVPLIVWPAHALRDDGGLWRSEDVHRLLLRLAGVPTAVGSALSRSEVFVTEQQFQTYRRGNWKLIRQRAGSKNLLFNVALDPAETIDLAEARPDIVTMYTARVDALASQLAVDAVIDSDLSESDADRLRSLGYLQ